MPPRINAFALARSIPYRPRAQAQWSIQPAVRTAQPQFRAFADSKEPPKARLQAQIDATTPLPHVSEEAAKTAEIEGRTGPQVEQGTPVEEVCAGTA